MDTLNKHEHILVVTHNVKVGLIVVFDSCTVSSIVLLRLGAKEYD